MGFGLSPADRANAAQVAGYQAKSQVGFTGFRRGKNKMWDGFADSSGINAGRAANYTVDTSAKCIKPTIPSSPSYANTGGTGDRTASITVSHNMSNTAGSASATVNGDFTPSSSFDMPGNGGNQATVNGDYIRWDFGSGNAKYINEFKIYSAAGTGSVSGLKFQGSNNGTTWTDLVAFTWTFAGTGSQTVPIPTYATTYRYFQIVADGTSTWLNNFLVEMEFKISAALPIYNNLTYSSILQTADEAATSVVGYFEIDPIDAITLGTDLTGIATCNGWTNSGSVTLVNVGKGQAGRALIMAVATGLTGGTSFGLELTYANNKNAPIYFVEVGASR